MGIPVDTAPVVRRATSLLHELEEIRGTRIISYITGDRGQFATKIGDDILPILFHQLESFGASKAIDLFLYTRGGDMVVPIRLVKLIRSYCKKFSVIIPFRAQSAGTLISLGADEIIMGRLAELTPVDPTAENHPFNPRDPQDVNRMLPVMVEDARSYFLFAKDELKAKADDLVKLYSQMTSQAYPDKTHLHPLALGNVYRAQRMIQMLARRLLSLHSNGKVRSSTIKNIIRNITREICVHNYPIYQDEAATMGLNAKKPAPLLEKKMWELYETYSNELEMAVPFDPMKILGEESRKSFKLPGATMESINRRYVFNYSIEISRLQAQLIMGQPPAPPIAVNVTGFGWDEIQ